MAYLSRDLRDFNAACIHTKSILLKTLLPGFAATWAERNDVHHVSRHSTLPLYRGRAEMMGEERGGSGAGGASILPLLQQILLKNSVTSP
jgi:hypothetical protein